MNPEISVVLPVYNGEKYFKEAVESVLGQTFGDFELIIVNDGSTDRTEALVKPFLADRRVHYLKNEENLGLSKSFNKGIRAASAAYVARMDADDVALPDRFAKQLAFLESHPEIGIVGSAAILIDENGRTVGRATKALEPKALRWQSLFSTPLIHPTVFARTDILKENPYDERLANSEDYELWSRLMFEKDARLANLAEPLLLYRVFPASFTKSLSPQKRLNSIANSLKNMERYIPLSDREKEVFTKSVIGKPSLKESFEMLKLYRRLRNEFIARESFTPSLKPFFMNLLKRLFG